MTDRLRAKADTTLPADYRFPTNRRSQATTVPKVLEAGERVLNAARQADLNLKRAVTRLYGVKES